MRTDTRLSRVLHVLVHLTCDKGPFTSEQLAGMLDTNAVLVRRTMAGLRNAGYVKSEKGHRGGWSLSCNPEDVSLLDIYKALDINTLFALGINNDTEHCLIERTVNEELEEVLSQAEKLLMDKLEQITLSHLCKKFNEYNT